MYKAIIKRWDGREHILLDSDRDYLEQFARFVVCKLEEEEHEVKSMTIKQVQSRFLHHLQALDRKQKHQKKALRELDKAVKKRNERIEELEEWLDDLDEWIDEIL